MINTLKAFRVDFVNLLGAGGTRGEPSIPGDLLQPPDGGAIAGRAGKGRNNFIAREIPGYDLISGELAEDLFLLGGRWRIDAFVDRGAELARQVVVRDARIAAGDRGYLRGEQSRNDAVLVGCPYRAVAP